MTTYQLHLQISECVKTERKSTHAVLLKINEFDLKSGYAEMGYPSLFEYLVKEQKYSEGSAQRRISAARLLREIPEVLSKIQEGKVNLTQLAKLSIAVKQEQKLSGEKVTSEEKLKLIEKIENKSSHETEKVLSQELHYSPAPQEKIVSKNEGVFLTLKLTQLQYEKLQKVQSHMSHIHFDGSMADIIETLCDKEIQKKEGKKNPAGDSEVDPAQTKSSHSKVRTKDSVPPTAAPAVLPKNLGSSPINFKQRVYLSRAIQREVFLRAQSCCEFVSPLTGQRCNCYYQLQIDHRIPLAKGGSNQIGNLRLLCRTHNLSEARRWGLQ